MNDQTRPDPTRRQLYLGIVLRVREAECEVRVDGDVRCVRYAPMFPSPRTERVHPGNIVALVADPHGVGVVLWRWYDAVVLGSDVDGIRLWEPAHGEVVARPRDVYLPQAPGSRAYLSAGLPGADWWVAGPVVAGSGDALVELDEVANLYTELGMWDQISEDQGPSST